MTDDTRKSCAVLAPRPLIDLPGCTSSCAAFSSPARSSRVSAAPAPADCWARRAHNRNPSEASVSAAARFPWPMCIDKPVGNTGLLVAQQVVVRCAFNGVAESDVPAIVVGVGAKPGTVQVCGRWPSTLLFTTSAIMMAPSAGSAAGRPAASSVAIHIPSWRVVNSCGAWCCAQVKLLRAAQRQHAQDCDVPNESISPVHSTFSPGESVCRATLAFTEEKATVRASLRAAASAAAGCCFLHLPVFLLSACVLPACVAVAAIHPAHVLRLSSQIAVVCGYNRWLSSPNSPQVIRVVSCSGHVEIEVEKRGIFGKTTRVKYVSKAYRLRHAPQEGTGGSGASMPSPRAAAPATSADAAAAPAVPTSLLDPLVARTPRGFAALFRALCAAPAAERQAALHALLGSFRPDGGVDRLVAVNAAAFSSAALYGPFLEAVEEAARLATGGAVDKARCCLFRAKGTQGPDRSADFSSSPTQACGGKLSSKRGLNKACRVGHALSSRASAHAAGCYGDFICCCFHASD